MYLKNNCTKTKLKLLVDLDSVKVMKGVEVCVETCAIK